MTSPHKPEQAGSGLGVSDNLTLSYVAELAEMDAQIEALQAGKRAFIAAQREEHGKRYATALKDAVKLSRMAPEKRAELDETDAETSRILSLIERSARRATRAREIIDEFDPETGEIHESEGGRTASESQSEQGTDTGSQPIQESVAAYHSGASDVVTPSSDESVTSREAVPPALPATVHGSRPDGSGAASPSPVGPFTSSAGHEGDASPATIADVDQRIDRQPPKLQAAGSNPAVGTSSQPVLPPPDRTEPDRRSGDEDGHTQSTAVRTDAPNQNAGGHGAVNAIEAGTQAPPVDTKFADIRKPIGGGGAAIASPETPKVAPNSVAADLEPAAGCAPAAVPAPKRQWKFNDPAHHDCLRPENCGGFSNLGLCPGCKAEAATTRQVAA